MFPRALNGTDACEELWCPQRSVSVPVYVTLYVAAAAVALLTVCGNLLVVVSVGHFQQLHTPAHILVLSLATSDLLLGAFVMPLYLSWLIESCWTSGPVVCSAFKLVNFQATSVSVHTVALIAVDRFLALSFPFLYSEKISPAAIGAATVCNWLLSLLYNVTLLHLNGNFTDVACPGVCASVLDGASSFVDLLVVFLIPCTVIIALYTRVFIIAKRHVRAIRALQVHRSPGSSRNRETSERRAAMLLGIVVVVFLLCLLPYYICSIVIPYSRDDAFHVRDVAVMFFFLNSTVNPIIYALFYPWFQKSLKLIFTFKVFDKDSSLMHVL